MNLEELKVLEGMLWNFKVKHGKELSKRELKSLVEILAVLIIKINK